MLALMAGVSPGAQQPKPLDTEVKAVYLLNFGRFATWPSMAVADAGGFSLCVLGRDPFGSTLDAVVAREVIDGMRVVTKRIAKVENALGCRILFVSGLADEEIIRVLQTLGKTSILTVSDMPQFVERGGMIQFVSQGNKVRFTVNVAAAEQAGLALSSELLRVAIAVRTSKAGA
jgi:hypothetical protein